MDLNHPAGGAADGAARPVELVAGDFLLTVNPVDGSEIESCPPGRRPIVPRRVPADGEDGAQPPVAPLLERDEERHRLYRLLARGRSVRLAGPSGTGRTALLTAVARDCADLAPDGVIRLSGYRRTGKDLLQELYAAVHHTPAYRPGPTELAAALREIGAVVILDDIEFGGAALGELLEATPECAFLIAAQPGVPGPAADSGLEEIFLSGLSRTASLELLELAIGRPLDEAETDRAADLWFETEGLPLRFVQAAAVLRRRVAGAGPQLPNAATLTVTLARGLTEGAREILRYAVALGGEVPGPARLPALTGYPDAATDYASLLASGLLTAVGTRHRLASGAIADLLAASYGDASADRALTAAQHYTWWLGQPGLDPAEAAAEAEALLAVVQYAQRAGHAAAVASLVRVAAPLLAATQRWSAWERVLRTGQEAARTVGEVAQQAYFHHELGVLAIVQGQHARARAELEASIALRGVLSDVGGTVAGRRALALVEDLTSPRAPVTPAQGVPVPALPAPAAPGSEDLTQVIPRAEPGSPVARIPRAPRRNAVAAMAGTALLALLGTVVAFGLSSSGETDDSDPDEGRETAPVTIQDDTETEDSEPSEDPTSRSPEASESPTASESPSPSESPDAEDPPVIAEEPPAEEPTDEETTTGGVTDDPSDEETTPPGSNGGSSSNGGDGGDATGDTGGSTDGADGGTDPGTSTGTEGGTDQGTSDGSTGETDAGAVEGGGEATGGDTTGEPPPETTDHPEPTSADTSTSTEAGGTG
ncbi:ATP-binding protein [Streptomyces litchfieldiae]|uniref:ATP-binding protein n=1 Tax=Streptomyces litchfieldiae TaxID=3075543 RepID=A0ABU2MII2_9ACTN|nr:ATP-binding protein [Streptomyces sp. DSM 44938]MDT0341405.1 ATP-binding protein [Streptomyces sp. DSM 44938]